MKVTREQILTIMPNAKDKVDAFLPYINEIGRAHV